MFVHIPVLYHELLASLNLKSSPISEKRVVDATVGLGWHASWILQQLNTGDSLLCLDADQQNLNQSQNRLEELRDSLEQKPTLSFSHTNFAHLHSILAQQKWPSISHIYYDLGLNSAHVDDSDRGFSFSKDAPLDMRFDRTKSDTLTAKDVVNTYSAHDLSQLMWKYGEEKKTPFIVQAIEKAREIKPIETTKELAEIIKKASFDPKSVTRVFQAIRMEVNQELQVIEQSLKAALEALEVGGRCSVITFHSLEDRVVKHFFAPYLEDEIDDFTGQIKQKAAFKKVVKKPLVPSEEEIKLNPRSRSAKLRCIEKMRPL